MSSSLISRHPVVAYFLLAYAISWTIWSAMIFRSLRADSGIGSLLFIIGTFGPLISAFTLTKILEGNKGVRELAGRVKTWRVSIRWYLIVLLLPGTIALWWPFFLAPLMGSQGAVWARFPPVYVSLIQWLVYFLTILVIGGPLAEEFGWRGYALPRMEANRNAFGSSAVLGVFWGLWHLPLFWLPGSTQNAIASGVSQVGLFIALFIVELTGLSVIMAWVFNNTKGSVLLALFFHSSLNSTTVLLMLAKSKGAIVSGGLESYAVSGLITWIIVGVIVVIAGPRRLKRMTGDK